MSNCLYFDAFADDFWEFESEWSSSSDHTLFQSKLQSSMVLESINWTQKFADMSNLDSPSQAGQDHEAVTCGYRKEHRPWASVILTLYMM